MAAASTFATIITEEAIADVDQDTDSILTDELAKHSTPVLEIMEVVHNDVTIMLAEQSAVAHLVTN